MMVNFDELENKAKKYEELKKFRASESVIKKISTSIIDCILSSDFSFPIQKEAVVSNGTTTYIYKNNCTYPNLFEFIAKLLHTKIPITLNNAKFGPGEIIVCKGSEKEAQQELDSCMKELQKLIFAKRGRLN